VPTPEEGFICELILNAAGGFSGYRIAATNKDNDSIARARAIRDAGIRLFAQNR
jgi:hypothetical protein